MRNSAFSTVTTNSRGVKSSLTRMTLCRRGRSVLVLTFVLGLITVSIIPAGTPDVLVTFSRCPKPEYCLPAHRGTGCFAMASLQRRHGAQIGDDIGEIGLVQSRIGTVGHRLLERPPVAGNPMGDGALDFGVGPGADTGGRV